MMTQPSTIKKNYDEIDAVFASAMRQILDDPVRLLKYLVENMLPSADKGNDLPQSIAELENLFCGLGIGNRLQRNNAPTPTPVEIQNFEKYTSRKISVYKTPESTPSNVQAMYVIRPGATRKVLQIGDLHGDFLTLIAILIKSGFLENPQNFHLIQYGDIIDRGTKSIELLIFLLALGQVFQNLVLLPGNHELNEDLRFNEYLACESNSLFSYRSSLLRMIISKFEQLPIACINLTDRSLHIHGAPVCQSLVSLHDIVRDPQKKVWSAPSHDPRQEGKLVPGRANFDAIYCGQKTATELRNLGFTSWISGHIHNTTKFSFPIQNGDPFNVQTLMSTGGDSEDASPVFHSSTSNPNNIAAYAITQGNVTKIETITPSDLNATRQLIERPSATGQPKKPIEELATLLQKDLSPLNIAQLDQLITKILNNNPQIMDSNRHNLLHLLCAKHVPTQFTNEKTWLTSKIKSCLEKGVRVDQQDFMGCTPLHAACYKGNADLFLTLMDLTKTTKKIDFLMLDKIGNSLLHYAMQQYPAEPKIIDVVQKLIAKKLSFNSPNALGETPLHYLFRTESNKLQDELMLPILTDPNMINAWEMQDIQGNTPLHVFLQNSIMAKNPIRHGLAELVMHNITQLQITKPSLFQIKNERKQTLIDLLGKLLEVLRKMYPKFHVPTNLLAILAHTSSTTSLSSNPQILMHPPAPFSTISSGSLPSSTTTTAPPIAK